MLPSKKERSIVIAGNYRERDGIRNHDLLIKSLMVPYFPAFLRFSRIPENLYISW
jgi:hypothetical protein